MLWIGRRGICYGIFGFPGTFPVPWEDSTLWRHLGAEQPLVEREAEAFAECMAVRRCLLWDSRFSWLSDHHESDNFAVTFNLPEQSETILVLSQSNTRHYQSLCGTAEWSFDFKVFKAGSKDIIGSSSYSTALTRSVTLRINLLPGDYVVHVRWESLSRGLLLKYFFYKVRLDREYKSDVVWILFFYSLSLNSANTLL